VLMRSYCMVSTEYVQGTWYIIPPEQETNF